ncbi:hypothetical protein DFR71_5738 [Nocardia alba]|uniref:Uncharacterized protein n=1 Tax=Nocardia alba TaxID=225051 RepID=A0A4R1FEB3_9NOCA|nr:hypothetical protein DFR71_5738 [Nocardia alba]
MRVIQAGATAERIAVTCGDPVLSKRFDAALSSA